MEPELQQVADGVFHVTASHTNMVALVEDGVVALVDTGYPGDRRLVERVLERLGTTPARLAAVVLTHAHVDHLGNARWLQEAGAPVRCLDAEAPHARGEVDEVISTATVIANSWHPRRLVFGLRALRNGALRPVALDHVDRPFRPGSALDLPGAPVPVHTPGHTSGHACFHLPDRGVVVTGDALITVDVWNERRTGPQLIRRQFTHDLVAADQSLDRIASLDGDVLLPGHGAPWFGSPADAAAIARERAA